MNTWTWNAVDVARRPGFPSGINRFYRLWLLPLAAAFLWVGGCDDLDDDGEDYDPPEGKGALFINNDSLSTRVHVYIDGEKVPGRTGAGRTDVVDLDPGEYRVLLVNSESERVIYREDVDILPGRVSVVDVIDGYVGERLE